VMEYYPPQNVLWSGNLNASYSAQQLDKLFARESIPVTRAEAGQTLDLGGEARLKVMYAGGRGIILLVEYKNFRALLPLGMDTAALDALQTGEYLGKVDVFLLADSGYAPSNPPNFITSLNPQLVVLSVDAGDSYGLPNEEVLESLEGYSLLRTDRSGWISVITDGNEMRVEVERGAAQPTPTP